MTARELIKKAVESVSKDDFRFTEFTFAGESLTLVNPIAFPKWTQTNKYLRSCVYKTSDFTPISLGFSKFTNLGENPSEFPPITDLKGVEIVQKIDGSLLIVSVLNSQFLIRTRGSTGYDKCLNASEIEFFKSKYENLFDYIKKCDERFSFLFEWVSPKNVICLNYKEADLYLIGIIEHDKYELVPQAYLDYIAPLFGVKRPTVTTSTGSLSDLLLLVKQLKNEEGYCLYKNQDIFKVKSDDYLVKHAFKSNINFENVLDMFFIHDKSVEKVLKNIESTFDFECSERVKPLLNDCDLYYQITLDNIDNVKRFVKTNEHLSRKDFANKVNLSLISPIFKSTFFYLLDKKEITSDYEKKLVLKLTESYK